MDVLKQTLQKNKKFLMIAGVVFLLLIVASVVMTVLNKPKEEPYQTEEGAFVGEPIDGLTESQLTPGSYYIRHNGYYYPAYQSIQTIFPDNDSENTVDCRRILAMGESDSIPTLYLENGDELVYFSTTSINSYVAFERFTDFGYSIGMNHLIEDEYSKQFVVSLDVENSDVPSVIIAESSAGQILKDFKMDEDNGFTYLTINKIGDEPITEELISKAGLIKGLKRNKTYNVEVYNGTIRNTYDIVADTYYMTSMECFMEAGVTLNGNFQEIEIPSYFKDGYYLINQAGLVRIVNGSEYTEDTNFNERLLEIAQVQAVDSNGETIPNVFINDPYNATYIYSSIPSLNKYVATTPGSFGYALASEETEETEVEEGYTDEVTVDIDSDTEMVPVYDTDDKWAEFLAAYKEKWGKDFEYTTDSEDLPNDILVASDGTIWEYATVVSVEEDNNKTHLCVKYAKPKEETTDRSSKDISEVPTEETSSESSETSEADATTPPTTRE